ncbi:MAG: hypothetical protein DYH20_10860 [Gammaproteobacteria bacterium PRO9]|nr:hypothetical protein [Gammaproteobacteria bacterium PRO9]
MIQDSRNREQGAAMVIALVMLVVLTLLATASARMTLMEERMTGNTQDRTIAFQANANGLYESATPGSTPVWNAIDWSDSSAVLAFTGMAGAPGMLEESSSSYIVEELPRVSTPGESLAADVAVDDATFYRVTSRGVGVSGNAVVTLQTTFKR